MNEIRYKKSPPPHYEPLTYTRKSKGRALKYNNGSASSSTTSASASASPSRSSSPSKNSQRRRNKSDIWGFFRKGVNILRSRTRTRIGFRRTPKRSVSVSCITTPTSTSMSTSKKRRKHYNIMELFKIAASILLLASSGYTYRAHFKFHRDEEKHNIRKHNNNLIKHGHHADADADADNDGKEEVSDGAAGAAAVAGKGAPSAKKKHAEIILPSFLKDVEISDITPYSYDAYAIAKHYQKVEDTLEELEEKQMQNPNESITKADADADDDSSLYNGARRFLKVAQELRDEFSTLYGGEKAARIILQRGITIFSKYSSSNNNSNIENQDSNIHNEGIFYTAKRIQQARKEKRPFTFGFAGYSVTAGRGNHFNQSFPFVMERILSRPMQELGIDLHVRNAAIGGVPSFPYGFCLDNFLTADANRSSSTHSSDKRIPLPLSISTSSNNVKGRRRNLHQSQPLDVLSWDFSMNEANDVVEGMEGYIRQVLTLENQDIKPMLLVKDTHLAEHRRRLIDSYVKTGSLMDPIVLHTDQASEPFLEVEEDSRPIGFQRWRDFGSPPEAPGKSKHHPAVKEHEFIGWLTAMHFLSALEVLAASDMKLDTSPTATSSAFLTRDLNGMELEMTTGNNILPPPFSRKNSAIESMIYGTEGSGGTWKMNRISCRTSFEPLAFGDLKDLVISDVQDSLDLMLPKGPLIYNKGRWVLDLGDAERKAKQQLERYGGLGFLDSKKSYYGVFASGPLRLFIPHANKTTDSSKLELSPPDNARDAFTTLILCESNENKRNPMACNMATDLSFEVGGVRVAAESVKRISLPGFSYLGRDICVSIEVPSKAKITNLSQSVKVEGGNMKEEGIHEESVGVAIELAVSNKRIRTKDIACNLSHVVWQTSNYK